MTTRIRPSGQGRASDVTDLVTHLCRDESGYITDDVTSGAHIH